MPAVDRPQLHDLPTLDDQYLVNSGFGIFTSVSGTAPNRIFNIEWRAQYFPGSGNANYELSLYEGQTRFDVIYGTLTNGNTSATAGCRKTTPTSSSTSATARRCGYWRAKLHLVASWHGKMNRLSPMHDATRPRWRLVLTCTPSGFNAAPNYTHINERFNGTSWTTLAPIPVPHAQSRGTAVGTNIYVPGGFNSVWFGGPLDTMQIYNTTANTWSSGMTLPAARSGVATAAFNGLVYVIGGYNPTGTGHNEVYIYNPGTTATPQGRR